MYEHNEDTCTQYTTTVVHTAHRHYHEAALSFVESNVIPNANVIVLFSFER